MFVLKRTGQAGVLQEGKARRQAVPLAPGREERRPSALRGRGTVTAGKGRGGRGTHGAAGSTKLPRLRVRWEGWAERRRRAASAAVEPRPARSGPARGCTVSGAPSCRASAPDPADTHRVPRAARTPPGELLRNQQHAPPRSRALQRRAGTEPGAERPRTGQLGGTGREMLLAPGDLPPPRSVQRPGRDFSVSRVGAESNLSGAML